MLLQTVDFTYLFFLIKIKLIFVVTITGVVSSDARPRKIFNLKIVISNTMTGRIIKKIADGERERREGSLIENIIKANAV